MADIFNINKIKQVFSDYIRVKFELLKLDLSEHLANILAQVIAYIVILLMTSLVLGFASMGISFYLNEILDSNYMGFLIIAGFYLFILIVVFILLKSGKLKSMFEGMLMPPVNIDKEDDGE